MERTVGELASGLEPTDDVKVEVVSAGAASEEEWKDGDERSQRQDDIRAAIARHGLRVSQRQQLLPISD
jgi:hypothetical protein